MVDVVCPHCNGMFLGQPGQHVLCPHCRNPAGVVPGGDDDGAEGGFGLGGLEHQLQTAAEVAQRAPVADEGDDEVDEEDLAAENKPDEIEGFAVASLVLGLCFFIPVGGIVAVIMGLVYLSQDRPADDGKRGMAIAGIIFGGIFQLIWFGLLIMLLAGIGRGLEALGGR